jgi:hypothetical protein
MPSVGVTSDSSFAVGQSALRSSGTSPNFRISFASPKSPVAGSPLRLNATAPACPGLATGLGAHDRGIDAEALRRLAGSDAVVGENER